MPRAFLASLWFKLALALLFTLAAWYTVAEALQLQTGFVVEAVSNQNKNGRPTAVVRFSRPLATTQVFDDLASITTQRGGKVEGAWVLSRDARSLEFPFLQALSDYQVNILAKLRAADGSELGTPYDQRLQTTSLSADARFMSTGSVIPRSGHQGLPIVSTNVSAVDVEFLRVRASDYHSFFLGYQIDAYSRWAGVRRQSKRAGGETEAEHNWKTDLERITDFTDSVYQQRFAVAAPQDERALTYLPVQRIKQLQGSGVYMAVMKQPNAFPNNWHSAFFFVTDLGLHARRYQGRVWVHAASLKTGKPLAGTKILAYGESGALHSQVTTDALGNAWLDVKQQGNGRSDDAPPTNSADRSELLLLTGQFGDEVAMLPFNQPAIDLSALPITGRKQEFYDVFTWGSRDLYRPGESITVHALLRDSDGQLLKAGVPVIAQLLDPNGESVESRSLDVSAGGYLKYSYKLGDGVATGLYKLRLSTNGDSAKAPYTFDIHVEEFLPERLKITLTSAQARLEPGEALALKAEASYLYGAPASGNRFVASMVLKPANQPIGAFSDFHFGDASARFDSTPTEVLDATFDANGLIESSVDLSAVAKDKGPVEVVVLGEVQESGGSAVNRVLKRTIWPAPVLLGVRPQFNDNSAPGDSIAKLELIASDAAGTRQSVAGVKVRVLRDWRDYSWYYAAEGGMDVSVISATTLESEAEVSLAADGRPFELAVPIKWGGYWVELIHPESGVVTRYHFAAGWSWSGDDEMAREPRPDQIKLELDKPSYRVGDTLRLKVHAPQSGPGFVLVEGAEQLFYAPISAAPDAEVSIPIDARFATHDIYVSAVVFRPDGSPDALLPSRSVGMIHLPLDRAARSVLVQLDAPKLARPGAPLPVAIKVPALKGQTGYLVLTAVDVGITNITKYEIPDPAGFFFGARRFGLDLYDMYGRIVDNYAGQRATLRYGGDSESPELPSIPRDKLEVKLVDLYEGPVQLDAQGNALINLVAPDFDGTLKLTAVVFTADHFGRASSEALVRQPVVAQLSAPRALAPGDRSNLALDIHNLSGSAQDLAVSIKTTGGISVLGALPASLKLADAEKRNQLLSFNAERLGPAGFTVDVRSGEGQISRSVATVVRPAYAPERRSVQLSLTGPISAKPPASLTSGLLPGARLQVNVSNRPLLPLAGAARELTEKMWWYSYLKLNVQRGFAHLLLDGNARTRFGLDKLDEVSRRALIQAAIDDAVAAQTPLGHFNMWGKESWVDTQLTPYIAEFWIKAKLAGYTVEQSALDRTLNRMASDLLAGGNAYLGQEHHEAIKFANNAYAAYVLSLNNAAPLGVLRTLWQERAKDAKTMLPLVQLALALRQMGDTALSDQALAMALQGKWNNAWGIGDYGSAERDLAWSYALLSERKLLTPAWNDQLLPLSRNLAGRSREKAWKGSYLSMDESLALVRLGVELLQAPSEPIVGSWTSGQTQVPIQVSRLYSAEFSDAQLATAKVQISSAGALYVEWNSVGFATTAPPADQSQVAISRSYYTLDGAAFTGTELKQGARLLVHLRVQAERDIRDAVLVDLQPGGLEVENLHLGDFAELASVKIEGRPVTDYSYGSTLRRQEYLDDRYLASIDFASWHGGTINLFYIARAVTPGDYIVPPPFVEDMYRPQIRGNGVAVLGRLRIK